MKTCSAVLLTITTIVLASGNAQAQWGNIEGQVLWGGKALPVRKELNITKDRNDCLRNGKILDDLYLVDAKTQGVRYCVVWIMPANAKGEVDFKAEMPIHKNLKDITEKKVVLDQPCCMFTPHVLCLREGQILTAKNSDKVAHNTNIQAQGEPGKNFLLPPGGEQDVKGWQADGKAIPVGCTIHPWMNSWIRVFNHPYFVVTGEDGKFSIKNAPTGRYRLIAWHPTSGWLLGESKHGVEIKIEDKKTVKVADIQVMPSPDSSTEKK